MCVFEYATQINKTVLERHATDGSRRLGLQATAPPPAPARRHTARGRAAPARGRRPRSAPVACPRTYIHSSHTQSHSGGGLTTQWQVRPPAQRATHRTHRTATRTPARAMIISSAPHRSKRGRGSTCDGMLYGHGSSGPPLPPPPRWRASTWGEHVCMYITNMYVPE
jgi:hypothetical protein